MRRYCEIQPVVEKTHPRIRVLCANQNYIVLLEESGYVFASVI